MFQRVKGTQDFLDLSLFKYIITTASKQLSLYHFKQIETPILESTDLFKRTLGLETDVVSKEMYTLNTGPDSESICLRPEATAPTMRAFLEHGIQQHPWKVFSWGSMFRHERPQKGRYRQFHQINIEVIGAASIAHDVQLIAMLDDLFSHKFGFNEYALVLNFLGCREDRAAYKKTLYLFLQTVHEQICATCNVRKETNIMRVFDCKNTECQKVYEKAPQLLKNLCASCSAEWQQLQEELEMLAVAFTVRPTLVRGLDYYNKTVFEFVSQSLGAQNAFCGGGRYDHLATELGSKEEIPSLGAAIGIERLLMILEPFKERLPLEQESALHVILPLSQKEHMLGLLLAQEMTAADLCTDIILDAHSIKSMMRHANKMGAKYCVLVGEEEVKNKEVTIKNMVTGAENKVKQVDVVSFLRG